MTGPPPDNSPAVLRAEQITCCFGPFRALDGVSLELRAGEIHALCGENGAGKSTLINCLCSSRTPDTGRVTIDGQQIPSSVVAAERKGIAVIHQDPIAFPDLRAYESVFVGRELTRAVGCWIDRTAMRRRTRELLRSLGEEIDVERPVAGLPLAQRQMIAIARTIALDCRFLILDEPTASLSRREADVLHALLRSLASRGVGVLLVSHRLEEVLMLASRITVLRDGRHVTTVPAATTSRAGLVAFMVGRTVNESATRRSPRLGPVRLEVRDLVVQGGRAAPGSTSLRVRAGEIVGLGGLVGAGRSELARAIAGIDTPERGEVTVNGVTLKPGCIRVAIEAGLVLVPEDRRDQGLVTPMSVSVNLGLSNPPGYVRAGLLSRRRASRLAAEQIARLGIKTRNADTPVANLSGGNQQKVLLGKWLAHAPSVLILDEPTRGVDVGAKAEIHSLIRALADQGAGVLLISSDLPELLSLSDRVLVMRQGRISGLLEGADATPEALLSLAVPIETSAGACAECVSI